MSEWTWEYTPDDYGDSLTPPVRAEVGRMCAELAVVNSMVFWKALPTKGPHPGCASRTAKPPGAGT
ncbi:hypothetical protein [Streptomyces kronopolitis]